MPEVSLVKTRIISGTYEGLLSSESGAATAPSIAAHHLETPLEGITLTPVQGRAGKWMVRVPIPAELLADGVQTVLITEVATGARLDAFTLVTGIPLEDDIRAEVDLLRSELDMLKRAFRRHCVDTAR